MADAIALLEKQEWLKPAEDAVQTGLSRMFEAGGELGGKVRNLLNGTWLGHALHPVITDIPVGAWTMALVLDLMEVAGAPAGMAEAADAAVTVGLVGALGAAATGLTDWKDTDGKDRRVGFVHGVLNIAATAFFAGSLVARKTGRRGTGRALAVAGLGLTGASAWLGGELVFHLRNGVDRSHEVAPPADWFPLMQESDLPESKPTKAEFRGTEVLLVRRGNGIHAIANRCSHRAGPLAEGTLEGNCITCPWHGSKFDVTDGSVVDGPATIPQPVFEVRVRDGMVEARPAA